MQASRRCHFKRFSSERYASKRGLKHKKLTDWARQGMLQTIRWLPKRKVIFVGDSSFGTHELANSISKHGTLISRLRLDANLFELPPETNKRGRPRIKGEPLPKLTSYLNAETNAGQRSLHRIGMARKKKHSRLSPAQACGIEPALHQRYSDGCWCAILLGKWNRRRSSAPTPIWIQPKSSRTSQSDGKWRSLFRRCAPTSELKPNANGQKTRSRNHTSIARSLQSGLSLGAAGFGG